MKNVILFTVLLFVGVIKILAQTSDEVHKEDDGFEWIETNDGIAPAVAKHKNGKIIINPKLECNYIDYCTAEDGAFSVGYFRLTQYTKDYKMRDAICDINGNVIVPFKYDGVGMRVKVFDADTLAYIYTSDNKLEKYNIFDIKGKKIVSNINSFDIDDCGNFIDWESKKKLGIRMPKANGQLSNFYIKSSEKKEQTSLGLYEVQEKETDGFKWHLLYKGTLSGAQTVDGKIIIPVEYNCKEIKYDNGVFIGRTIDNVCCAYSKDGEEIIPISYNYYNISVDICTKTYLFCAKKNVGDNNVCLHDLNGQLIFPTGIYSNISPQKVNNKIYFIVSKDGKSQVLDSGKKLLLSIDPPCHVSDIYEDRLGIYYNILHSDIERNIGIVDDKGSVIIAPGRYDLIKRVENNKVAFYETTIIRGSGPNEEFLHGICDLEGHEILPNEYTYIPYSSTEIFKMDKGNMIYEFNVAQLIADAKAQRNYHKPSNRISSSSSYASSSFAPSSSSSYSSNTNSKYEALNDPNLVDNSEKIANAHQLIDDLESQKRNCSSCHGTGSIPTICTMCRGTGTIKMGYYTPQFFKCNYCGGTGKQKKQCITCAQTDMKISLTQSLLKTLQETHGMTKEVLNTYTEIKAWEHNQNMEHQRAIDAIAEPYLNSTRKSNSSHSSTSSSSKCSMCNGTGIDPHVYHSGDPKPAVGGYTHSSGGKCIYCGKYEWHQHVYCPKCNANKYP